MKIGKDSKYFGSVYSNLESLSLILILGDITFPGPTDGDASAPADDAPAPADDAAAPADGEGAGEGGEMTPVEGITMTLMTIDARIAELYNQILTELDEEKRTKDSTELTMLKVIQS